MRQRKSPRPRASGRTAKFSLDLGLSREALIQIAGELTPREPRLTWSTRTNLLRLLVQIIDQLPPRRDTRVNVRAWQLAMLTVALVDERNARPAKAALIAAIETLAPEKANDAKFRAFIERTYSKLRAGKNPARPQLLPVPPELLTLARAKLRKK